jgi:hypothetical protein
MLFHYVALKISNADIDAKSNASFHAVILPTAKMVAQRDFYNEIRLPNRASGPKDRARKRRSDQPEKASGSKGIRIQ